MKRGRKSKGEYIICYCSSELKSYLFDYVRKCKSHYVNTSSTPFDAQENTNIYVY